MVAWRFATLWLALLAPAFAAPLREAEPGATHQVIIDDLEVMIEPDASAYATASLRRGDRVVVTARQPGWAQIQAPPDNFHWINADDIEQQPDGTCLVIKRQTTVRYGSATARLPGPPWRTVPKGAVIRCLDRPELTVKASEGSSQTWRAIAATEDESRFVRLDGLARGGDSTNQPAPVLAPDRPERAVSYQSEPVAVAPNLPPEVNAELTSIAAMTRSIQSAPLETWNLDPVRGRYESLLRQFGTNPEVRSAVEPRLDQVHREIEMVGAAGRLARLLKAGDNRDAEAAQLQRSITLARAGSERGYDAQGFLQPSSRRSQGEKVLALIGPEGRPISYLSIPPGLPVKRYLARKVGVRGIVHFDEELGARLISVRDLELIEKNR